MSGRTGSRKVVDAQPTQRRDKLRRVLGASNMCGGAECDDVLFGADEVVCEMHRR